MFFSRFRLRRAALRLAAHGWPVTPGACLRAHRAPTLPPRSLLQARTRRFDCGRPGCPTTSCHPALEGWEAAASHDPVRVTGWWQYAPHSLLLATGLAFDVLEVAAPLAARAVRAPGWCGPVCGPVATLPTGQWMFLVRPGRQLLPELACRLEVVRHGRGSWVPAPPTRLVDGPVRWRLPPAQVGWRLPDGHEVQQLLADALPAGTLPGWSPPADRQLEVASRRIGWPVTAAIWS